MLFFSVSSEAYTIPLLNGLFYGPIMDFPFTAMFLFCCLKWAGGVLILSHVLLFQQGKVFCIFLHILQVIVQ